MIYGELELTISNQVGQIYGELELTISNQEAMPWINKNYVKNLYILGTEKVDTSFIVGKGLEATVSAATDNNSNIGIDPDDQQAIELEKTLEFLTETKDEASAFATNNTYTIPATGTYRFVATIILRNTCHTEEDMTIISESISIFLILNRGGVTYLDSHVAPAYVATELIDAQTIVLDSGYYHFIAGDFIYVNIEAMCTAHNDGLATKSVHLGTIMGTKLVNVWNNCNLHPGRNAPIDLEKYIPDMSQLDFLVAIRDIFNLRFWMDKYRRQVYVEPWDTFLSSTVKDLTEFIDFSELPVIEMISPSYSKDITLKWKDDTGDKAYEEYLKSAVSPDKKEITLTSQFADSEPDVRTHVWSTVIMGYFELMQVYSPLVAKIFNTNVPNYSVYDRKVGFNTRIVEWKGMTSGLSFNYEGETKTTYPKIQGLSFDYIFTNWFQKLFHYIDKGKLFTIKMKINPIFLSQFLTVVNNAENEGFRPTYKITIDNIDNYFALQKITSDGESAECEFFLKQ
jgi:hypothetical protein